MVDEGSTPGKKRNTGFISMKQDWLDQVATDPKLSPAALRIAIILHNHFNQHTLECFVGRDKLAEKLGMLPNNVSVAVGRLKGRGHVKVRTVRRNNYYKMVLAKGASVDEGSPDSQSAAPRTGIDPHPSQVSKSIPNRYEDRYTNRQDNRSMNSAGGASAPSGATEIMSIREIRDRERAARGTN